MVAVVLVVLLLTACGGSRNARPSSRGSSPSSSGGRYDDIRKSQGSRYRSSSDSVPTAIPDVSKLPEPVPKVEPRSLYGNKSPYSVLGQTYNVLPSPHGYVERGIASFYGNKFHGYKTSSLEEYDMYQFSAAHKTLPLPSYARVTNLENGKSVIVRVNDRGPFHENRVIDLSFAAAVKIGVWPKGTGLVEVRAIDPSDADSDRGVPYVNTTPKPGPVTAPPRAVVTAPPRAVVAASGAAVANLSSSRMGADPVGDAGSPRAPIANRVGSHQAVSGPGVVALPVARSLPAVQGVQGAQGLQTAQGLRTAQGVQTAQGLPANPAGSEEDDGPVPGMTGVSPADALPPLGGAGAGAGAKTQVSTMPATGRTAAANAPASAPLPSTVRAVTTVPPPTPVATSTPGPITAPVPGKPSIYLQVGAFSDAVNANRVADQLNRAGLGPVSVVEASIGGRNVRRVRVGPLSDVDTADRVTDQIAGMGLPRPQVAVD